MKKIISILLIVAILSSLLIPVSASYNTYFPVYNGSSGSLVDALTILGEDSSFAARAEIAQANGISGYVGSAEQNSYLLSLLHQGTLLRPHVGSSDGSANTQYYPQCNWHYVSIVDALSSLGIDSSFSNRSTIASLNGINDYTGSFAQNSKLLSLLKQGKLVKSIDSVQNSNFAVNPYVCYNYQQCTKDGHDIFEITKANAPLRQEPRNTGKVITRLSEGQLLSVAEVVRNEKNNDWLRIEYTDETGTICNGYMYAGNCTTHEHTYTNVLNNSNGTLKLCTKCAYTIVTANGQSIEKQLISVLDQAVMGDYSQEDLDFWGLVGRVLVGEIPYVGTAADLRDLVYDLTHDAHIGIIALDAIALFPLVGILKNADELYALKYANDLANTGELVVKVGKYKLSDEVLQLFMIGKGINGKNVSGAHNMQNFMQTITNNGGDLSKCIQTPIKHPTVDGIYNITYKVSETKNYARSAKTVYDPNVISDSQMFIWATEALSNATLKSGTTDYIVGWASNGLKFEAKIDSVGNILHFYPQFD